MVSVSYTHLDVYKRQVYTSADGTVQFHRLRGFKVQAFSGNNQRTSKDEAHRKQAQINAAFPEHETVVPVSYTHLRQSVEGQSREL